MSCWNTRVLPNAFQELANSSGNLTVTCSRPNERVKLTISGAARTSYIIVSRVRRRKGDIVEFIVTLPTTADIVLDFRNGALDGDPLLSAEKFPDQQFTTDGEITTARFRFCYDGGAWIYIDSQIPA